MLSNALTVAAVLAAGTVLVLVRPSHAAPTPPTTSTQDAVETFTKNAPAASDEPPPEPPPQPVAKAVAQFVGEVAAQWTDTAGAVGFAGQIANFANPGVRQVAEDQFKNAGLAKPLADFEKRQNGYASATKAIDTATEKVQARLDQLPVPGVVQGLAKGVVGGVSELVSAPVKVIAVSDSAISKEVAAFQAGDKVDKGIAIAGLAMGGAPVTLTSTIVVDGIGRGLANVIARTPQQHERAKKVLDNADKVLDMINPTKVASKVAHSAVVKSIGTFARHEASLIASIFHRKPKPKK